MYIGGNMVDEECRRKLRAIRTGLRSIKSALDSQYFDQRIMSRQMESNKKKARDKTVDLIKKINKWLKK